MIATMNFGEKIKPLMEAKRFKAADVAKAADVSESQYYAWISPKNTNRRPTVPQLLAICRLLGVTMESMADDDMDAIPADPMPADEATVLEAYRDARDHNGLTAAKAVTRLAVVREGIQPRQS